MQLEFSFWNFFKSHLQIFRPPTTSLSGFLPYWITPRELATSYSSYIHHHYYFNPLFLQHGLLFMKNANETGIGSLSEHYKMWPLDHPLHKRSPSTYTLTKFWSIFFILLHQNTGHLTTHGAEYHHQRGNPATNP